MYYISIALNKAYSELNSPKQGYISHPDLLSWIEMKSKNHLSIEIYVKPIFETGFVPIEHNLDLTKDRKSSSCGDFFYSKFGLGVYGGWENDFENYCDAKFSVLPNKNCPTPAKLNMVAHLRRFYRNNKISNLEDVTPETLSNLGLPSLKQWRAILMDEFASSSPTVNFGVVDKKSKKTERITDFYHVCKDKTLFLPVVLSRGILIFLS